MIWLRLKLDLLPCISQEVDKVSKDYMGLVEESRKGDKTSYQNLISLQTEVRNRIDELDRFYERNYSDFRIAYFEKLKLRLRKLLSSNIDVNVFIQEEQRNQLKKTDEKIARSPQLTTKKNQAETAKYTSPPSRELPKQKAVTSQIPVTRPQTQPIAKKNEKLISDNQNKKTAPQNLQITPNKPTATIGRTLPSKTPPKINEFQKEKKSPMTIPEKNIKSIEKTAKQGKTNDEVVFMIKMTKEEYMEYQTAKSKRK